MSVDILYQFNEKYAPYAAVSMASLYINNSHLEEIRVFILGEDLSVDSMQKLRKLSDQYERKLVFVDTTKLVQKMKKWKLSTYRNSYAANMRLFLSEVLDDSVGRLLYLDADTLIKGKLDSLFKLNMKGYAIAMVMDSIASYNRTFIGFDLSDNYYNSGVILFDLPRWKEEKYSEKIMEYVQKVHSVFSSPDQDLLNIVCKNRIMTLHPRYNFQPMHKVYSSKVYSRFYLQGSYYSTKILDEASSNPVIMHYFRYLGEFPWHKQNLHPFNNDFDKYLKVTPWYNYSKEAAETNFFIKIEKIMYQVFPPIVFLVFFRIAHNYFGKKAHKAAQKSKKYKYY